LKAHFEFRQVYNVQIIKCIQVSNVTSKNSVQRYICWKFNVSDTSLERTQALTLCGSSEERLLLTNNCELI